MIIIKLTKRWRWYRIRDGRHTWVTNRSVSEVTEIYVCFFVIFA